jgi:hypothetical protein
MSASVLTQLRGALANLNPAHVREMAEQPFTIGLLAVEEESLQRLTDFLVPPQVSDRKARRAGQHALRIATPEDFERCDFGLTEPGVRGPKNFYTFDGDHGQEVIRRFLDRHEDLWVPVARHFVPFRDPVVERLISKIAKENALFAAAAALPNVAPTVLPLFWSVGEFASDTTFLTVNQIRLAFLIAAASDAAVGYKEQRGQIASIVTSAFGWRALARELVSKIPFGGGLLAKASIAYAGTYVVGLGLDRYQRLGRGLTADEKKVQYHEAYERGKLVVEQIVKRWKSA